MAPGAETQDEQQIEAEQVAATAEEAETAAEGSTQEEVRQEIAGADLDEQGAVRAPESRPHRPERQSHRFQPRPARQQLPDHPAARQRGSAIRHAIQDVERIVNDLRESLEEMEEVLETLEQAEREKTADEREIEQLRRALKNLHRGRDSGPRPQQYGQGQQRESREQPSWRGGPEHRDVRSRAAESEGRGSSEATQPEPEHRDESLNAMNSPEIETPDEGDEPPQPS